ncbi:hypothetical protein U9M48_027363 [Paspalum notatum var. saurae]|uniref:Uncharacterized protein n=1 Tax=Paspalum notatum var. saurae TaxID=547442 RepID=A0AAQ3TU90_PASNO
MIHLAAAARTGSAAVGVGRWCGHVSDTGHGVDDLCVLKLAAVGGKNRLRLGTGLECLLAASMTFSCSGAGVKLATGDEGDNQRVDVVPAGVDAQVQQSQWQDRHA